MESLTRFMSPSICLSLSLLKELDELEAALEEYFDVIASEFDEFRGSRGRGPGSLLRPPPPILKQGEKDCEVMLEWNKWKGQQPQALCQTA